MSEHSRYFAPSSAARWVRCTASANAAAQYSDPPGEAAMEGTAWHWLVEHCLSTGTAPTQHVGRTILVREDDVERSFVVSREMAADVGLMLGYIADLKQVPGLFEVEARVDLSWMDAGMFGRCDIWHYGRVMVPELLREVDILTVADGKYGRVDVPVQYDDGALNWQMVAYALGIIENLRSPPEYVRLVIVQPRSLQPVPRIKQVIVPVQDVWKLTHVFQAAIERVKRNPTFVSGSWCKYCPALGSCPATKDDANGLLPMLTLGDITPADAGRILAKKDLLDKIVKEAERVALDTLLRGAHVPGFKLVTSTKHRVWRDEDAAYDRLAALPNGLKPITPAQAEKLPGGKEIVAELAETPPGEPAVAKLDDKRKPYVARSAAAIFGANG